MAAKKELTCEEKISELFTKLTNVLGHDLYIVSNHYAIGGEETNEDNTGEVIAIFSNKYTEVLDEFNPNMDVLFIDNIRETKKDFSRIEWIKPDDPKVKFKLKYLEKLVDLFVSQEEWNSLELTEEEQKLFFEQYFSIELFKDREDVETMICSKSAFPLLSEKTVDKFYWNYSKEVYYVKGGKQTLPRILTSLDFDPYFQIYGRYVYIPL